MKNKIKYSTTDTLPASIDPKDVSIRISIVMEGDLLDALKAKAAKVKRPYQTIMKEILRAGIEPKSSIPSGMELFEERLSTLEHFALPAEDSSAWKAFKRISKRSTKPKRSTKKAG